MNGIGFSLERTDFFKLMDGLSYSTTVKKLNLKNNDFGPDGFEKISSALSKNQSITHLNLKANNLVPCKSFLLSLNSRRHNNPTPATHSSTTHSLTHSTPLLATSTRSLAHSLTHSLTNIIPL